MTMKGMLLLSLLLGVNLIDGSRIQAAGGGKPFVQTSGTCKAWCMKQAVGFPIDIDLLKEQANEKCHTDRGMKECKDCNGGGLTIPDCREKTMSLEDTDVAEEEDEEVAQLSPLRCAQGEDYSTQLCSFQEGEICSHIDQAWCAPPSRNAGDSFRNAGKPLCCSAEGDSNLQELNLEVKAVQDALETSGEEDLMAPEEDPKPPMPLCAVGHSFKVDSFTRNNEKVHVCRDEDTGTFAKKVCCDAATFKLLEDKEKAEDVCENVKNKHCNVNVKSFNDNRDKYPKMPQTFSCKRMYFCIYQGKEKFGPVPSHKWCMKDRTGLKGHRSAEKTCVAVAAPAN